MGANKMAGGMAGAGQAAGQGIMGMYDGGQQKQQGAGSKFGQLAQGAAMGQGMNPGLNKVKGPMGPSDNSGVMAKLMQARQMQGQMGGIGQGQAMGGGLMRKPAMGGFAGGLGGILARRQQQQNPMASPEQQPINPYMQSPEAMPEPSGPPQMELGGAMEQAPSMAADFGQQAGDAMQQMNRPMAPRQRSFGRGRQY